MKTPEDIEKFEGMRTAIETSLPTIGVVIPCLNEEHGIRSVLEEFALVLPTAELIVVDNGSTDATAQIAAASGARLLHESRRGKARAVVRALSEIDTDVLIMVDGDGSYPAEGALKLLDWHLTTKTDMVTGIRCEGSESKALIPLHQMGSQFFSNIIRWTFGTYPPDVFSGLRLFSRRFYKNIPILSRGFELELELTLQANDKGFSIADVPVPFRERALGSHSKLRTFHDGFRILRFLLILMRDYKPLRFFSFIGTCLLVAGLAIGSVPVAEYFQTGLVNRLPLAVLAASMVNLSIFTFLTGLVLESGLRARREDFQIRVRNFTHIQ